MQFISASIWKVMRFAFAQMCCRSVATHTTWGGESSCVHVPIHMSRILHNLILNFCHLLLQNNQHIEVKWGSKHVVFTLRCCHSQVCTVVHSLLAWLSMLKQILSRGLFSDHPYSSNEVRILGMPRMARFKTFLERCIYYQIEDGWFSEKVKVCSPFYDWSTRVAQCFKLTGLSTRTFGWKYDHAIIM